MFAPDLVAEIIDRNANALLKLARKVVFESRN